MHSRTPPGELPPAAESPPSSALLDRLSFAGFVLAVLFLCFIGGALVILTDVFPAQAMKDAYRGGKAYVDKMKMSENPLASDFWQPERRPDKGVTLNTPDAYPGYTLYTSGHSSEASRSEAHTSELQSLMRTPY